MSSTNVHSNIKNNKNITSVAGSVFIPTERTLEVPPQKQVHEIITSYIEGQGNMEIPAWDSKVNENGTLEMENGNTIKLKNPNAYKNIKAAKQNRVEMKEKAKRAYSQEEAR